MMKENGEKRYTFEVELIKPTMPGIGLICTPRSLSITLSIHEKIVKCKINCKHGVVGLKESKVLDKSKRALDDVLEFVYS